MFANPVESFVQILTTMWNLLIQCEEDVLYSLYHVDKIRMYV
jgi:hypothetical protein